MSIGMLTVGPGDAATWPRYAGLPNDPRARDDDAIEQRAEAIEARTTALLTQPGFTPFCAENLCEALGDCPTEAIDTLCSHLRAGAAKAAGELLMQLARDYWEPYARDEAAHQIDAEALTERLHDCGRH